MIARVIARFSDGVLTPLEPLDLKEGAEVTVSVEETPAPKQGLETIVEMVDRLRESYPSDMWAGLPADMAKNKKHYLYGHAKEED